MTKEKYIETQIAMVNLGAQIEKLELDEFLAQISSTRTAGPLIDPTLYAKAAKNIEAIENLAKTFQAVKLQVEKTRQTVIQTAVAQYAEKDQS